MNQVRVIIKNSLVIYLAKGYETLIGFFLIYILSRYLGPDGFGQYAFTWAFIALATGFLESGLHPLLSRDMVQDEGKAGEYLGAVIIVRTFLLILVTVAIIIIVISLGKSFEYLRYCIIPAFLWLVAQFSVRTNITVFWAYERMEYQTLLSFIYNSLMILFILGAVKWDFGLIGIFGAMALANHITAQIGRIIASKKFLRPKFEWNFELWKRYLRGVVTLGATAIARNLYYQVDTALLAAMKDSTAIGFYNGAYRIIQQVSDFPFLITRPFFPVMARLAKDSKGQLDYLYQKLFKIVITISFPMAVAFFVLGDKIILLIVGTEFAGSVSALRWFALVVALTFPNILFSSMLIAMDKQRYCAAGMITCVVVNFILDVLLIPRFSYIGACIGTLSGEASLSIVTYYFVSRDFKPLPLHRLVLKPMLSSVIMGAIIYKLHSLNIFLLIIISIVIYFLAIITLRTFSHNEINVLKNALTRSGKGAVAGEE